MKKINLRASSISTLQDCPARWEAVHLRGIEKLPSSSAAHLGTAVHASTAVFDQCRIDGLNLKPAEAAGVFVDTLLDPNVDVKWGEELTKREAQVIGLTLHTKYCSEISPSRDFIAVEETMADLPVTFPEQDVVINITGHVDRIFRNEHGIGIADLKTGRSAVRIVDGKPCVQTAAHAAQLGAYELLTEESINDALTAPAEIYGMGTGMDRVVGIGNVHSPKKILLGDADNQGLLEIFAKMVANELFFGNPRSQLCSAKYCPAFNACHWRR